MKLFGFEISRAINKDVAKPDESTISSRITERQLYRVKQDIQQWRNAITFAESTTNPDRVELIRIFNDVVLDAHLSSVMNVRTQQVIGKAFKIVDDNGDENEEWTMKMNNQVFNDFMMHAMESKYYGFSLVEFGEIKDDFFTSIKLLPRENVVPEKNVIKTDLYGHWSQGIDYTLEPYNDFTMFLGSNDLGLLNKATPLIIWKKGSMGAWSVRTDLFGMPVRIGHTDIRNPDSRGSMESMMKNMDVASWGVFDLEDKIEFVESSSTDAYKVYQELINTTNSEISKLFLGQTGTTDEKSYSGSAEVHEEVLEMIKQADCKFMTNCVNNKLIPLMREHGIIPDGLKFEFDYSEDLEIKEQFEIDKELLKYYNVPAEYITEMYGTPVESKPIATPVNSVMASVEDLYAPFLKDKNDCC